MPRKNGDQSFSRAEQTGCCSPDTHHAYTAGTPIGQYHSDDFAPQVLLIDAGGDWQNYAADITRTIPVGNGGRYTKEGGEIYELVLRMQKVRGDNSFGPISDLGSQADKQECEALVKPGAHWDAIHLHGHKVLVDGFINLGIFRATDTDDQSLHDRSALAEAILQTGVTAAFFPHGLGHSLGLDVHDSRQYLKSTAIDLPESTHSTPDKLYAYLRIRQPLLEGMVLTVEPGCYFPAQLMELHGVWTNAYVDHDVLKRYIPVGGVRIEDAVLVKAEGSENLTLAPRERKELDALCSGSA